MFMHYAQAQCAVKREVMVLANETDFSKFWPKMKELASTSVKKMMCFCTWSIVNAQLNQKLNNVIIIIICTLQIFIWIKFVNIIATVYNWQ